MRRPGRSAGGGKGPRCIGEPAVGLRRAALTGWRLAGLCGAGSGAFLGVPEEFSLLP